jgi:chromosome segregation protein
VFIKQLELTNFKSFGSTTAIPLLPGFTVVSGPNGSGKSNLLDALLFALGLSGSKGMRAERLPDLVNHSQTRRGSSVVETKVKVTFQLEAEDLAQMESNAVESEAIADDLAAIEAADATEAEASPKGNGNASSADGEWQVTRKLRVTKQGTYTSTYYINDQPCTLNDLHAQLNRLRIYPEGYNVVLQGDVTGIISMSARQRREIIDEMAGVADFDRKIEQAKAKLDTVKEREDRFRIVENELIDQRDRLARDRLQAEKYQKLRAQMQEKEQWESVLAWRDLQKQVQQLDQQVQAGNLSQADLQAQLEQLNQEIQQGQVELEKLNAQVKALGEEELLKVQATMATRQAEQQQLGRQQQELATAQAALVTQIQQSQQAVQDHLQALDQLAQQQQQLTDEALPIVQAERDQALQTLQTSKAQSTNLASTAEAWVQQQTQLRQQMEALLQTLNPQRAEQVRLLERSTQLERQLQEQTVALSKLEQELAAKQTDCNRQQAQSEQQKQQVLDLARETAIADQDLKTQQETQARLDRELREKQRQLDKLEAQQQAHQEVQGTYATRLIIQAQLAGVHGMVAQLGQVEPRYQLALEIAAGARLGHIVVDDDGVAAAGIELLKRERAGRATFLPLTKIQPARSLSSLQANEAIDYAVNLIDFDDRYHNIFSYVFGNTVVFSNLSQARRYMGQYRIVTLDGELLEATGAMTGGSRPAQQSIRFGNSGPAESKEITDLKQRLAEIEGLLNPIERKIAQAEVKFNQVSVDLIELRQQQRESQLKADQLGKEAVTLRTRTEQLRSQLQEQQQESNATSDRLQVLETSLPEQESQLAQLRQALSELEQSQTHSEWQQIQAVIQAQEATLQGKEQALRQVELQLQDLDNQQQRLQEKIQQAQANLHSYRQQQTQQAQQQEESEQQQQALQAAIANLQTQLTELEKTLGTEKQARDRLEQNLRDRTTAQQQLDWQLQKLLETQQERQAQRTTLTAQIAEQAAALPEPLPEVPEELDLEQLHLEQLHQELRSIQKRLQAMEPVNMLAIEEYDRTQARLEELSQKLTTLEGERTELLLRIEDFTTLRHQAFREAFDAVNANFQTIFAVLSEGDGFLQLENSEDPFQGGLNLVAHPKGKPVQRLASMSGGEKSLTALSFIFALQHYRPSPFYAFDEVDMFLDGANVERLSKMIQQQAQQAQFLVVSLRRPMIEASERTIGVTQARGTHTQVIGLQLRSPSQV